MGFLNYVIHNLLQAIARTNRPLPSLMKRTGVVVDYFGVFSNLEKALIFALARLGVVAGQRKGLTGVWVAADVWARCPRCDPALKPAPAKIASIGVKVDVHGISRHGFALNVTSDLAGFGWINPCGMAHCAITSLALENGAFVPISDVKARIGERFETLLDEWLPFESGHKGGARPCSNIDKSIK